MSRLRSAAHDAARAAPVGMFVTEKLLAIERIAAGLENRRLRRPAPAAVETVADLSDRALRRLIPTLWTAPHAAAPILAAIRARVCRSCDRALILGWLLHLPETPDLRETVALAADRHDWRWRERGTRWRLWEGPETLAAALRAPGADRAAILADAGLTGALTRGAFAAAAQTRSNGANSTA